MNSGKAVDRIEVKLGRKVAPEGRQIMLGPGPGPPRKGERGHRAPKLDTNVNSGKTVDLIEMKLGRRVAHGGRQIILNSDPCPVATASPVPRAIPAIAGLLVLLVLDKS